ncbi:MAG: MotB family protein [Gammaproteobacteria bacterium]|nr:MotB family protein [Gammaproteobacteria bacterium]
MPDKCPPCEAGLPPWLATFADLMSLLMCFFVLLLSFATVDAVRFKKMAESMKDAFGVQREVPAAEIVMGVSVIKQEWSPSVSEQAAITEIRQETSPEQHENLKMQDGDGDAEKQQEPQEPAPPSPEQLREIERQQAIDAAKAAIEKDLAEQFADLQEALDLEVDEGLVVLEREEGSIIVRVQEKGSFGSGSARLDPAFHEVMDRISSVLAKKPGKITVAGHTDNIPINTGRFRSNWELSSARAVTVLHSLLRNPEIAEDRVVVQGLADTKPVVDNDSPQNRAKNRRVEMILTRAIDENLDDLEDLETERPGGEQ